MIQKGKNYRPRVIDQVIRRKLSGIGAVLIEGPKQCGKTTTAEQLAGSALYMASPDNRQSNMQLAQVQPSLLLQGETPRLLDEWQIAPQLWDAVRFEVDHRAEPGQFILTGSAVPADRRELFHSGTGRFAWIRMRTMSLFESGDSSGQVSLRELFSGQKDIGAANRLDLQRIAFLTCRGGWPAAIDQADDIALDRAVDYVDAVVHVDLSRVDSVRRNPERVKRLLRTYARHQGTQSSIGELRGDMLGGGHDALSDKTVVSYLTALKKLFVVEDVPAWNPNLRSKTTLRVADTRYFTDPSIACAAMGIGPGSLIADMRTFGFFFETLCLRDLRVYADALNASVYHYRDRNGLECDAVISLRDGTFGLVEIKIGGDAAIEAGVSTLSKLAAKIHDAGMQSPAFLMVLTAVGGYAFRRPDGIFVVPIGCLRD
ncbi:MAG TPA: AAA family ATPase [Sutterella sp.]|nr:AAA family ATPase [Sutterella sp.]